VRTFFLFWILSSLLHSPLLALLVMGLFFYLGEAQWQGRYFNPARFFNRQSAISSLRRTLTVNPHDVSARNDLGRLLAEKGRFAEAREQLEAAIERMDDSAETQYWLGVALAGCGESEQAIEHLRRAVELEPRHGYGEARVTLAEALLESGDAAGATEQAAEAVRINTSSVKGWTILALAELARGNRQAAREACTRAEEAFADLPHYLRLANRPWRRQARRSARSID
jgi:tetratricopeptide (TPR) repeat protein